MIGSKLFEWSNEANKEALQQALFGEFIESMDIT